MKKKYYFAYGSNCNLDQMAFRCPKATVVGPVTLRNYRLTFNGKSNGWGVANVRRRNGFFGRSRRNARKALTDTRDTRTFMRKRQ